MDLDDKQIIAPVNATKVMQLAGGPQMIQAVPEEYFLASCAIRALEDRKGQNLDFIFSVYLPIQIISLNKSGLCVFVDLLGFSASPLSIFGSDILETMKGYDELSTKNDLIELMQEARMKLEAIAEITNETIPGLVSTPSTEIIARILDWPKRDFLEHYSLVLPRIIPELDITEISARLRESVRFLEEFEPQIYKMQQMIEEKILELLKIHESTLSGKIARLDQRILALEKDIMQIESRIAVRETADLSTQLESRKIALERDISRQTELKKKQHDYSSELIKLQELLSSLINRVLPIIADARTQMLPFTSSHAVDLELDQNLILLLPFVFAGFSKKGRLRIEIFPPSVLDDAIDKVSLRRDFVDPFYIYSENLEILTNWLRKRANHDVNFRKMLSSSAKNQNLLALEKTRTTLIEGAKLLLADGLIKESVLTQFEGYLKTIPVHKIKGRRTKLRTLALGPDSDNLCKVIFHIGDNSGTPIAGAAIDLGIFFLESNERGRIQVSLPKSHYEGQVTAEGFQPKMFEFNLPSTNEIVIPITLDALSQEEKVAQSLDNLIERAKRIDLIRTRLRKAFDDHGATLLNTPAYRSSLIELLNELGHDPEAWITDAKAQSEMMKRLLSGNEREDGIVRDILHLAEASKLTGGIMLFSELLVRLDSKGWETTSDEVETILGNMAKDGLLQGLSQLDNGIGLVTFLPVALTDDPQKILLFASQNDGQVTIENAVISLGWTEERVKNALDLLVSKGVAKIQKSYSKSTQYWFPGFRSGTE